MLAISLLALQIAAADTLVARVRAAASRYADTAAARAEGFVPLGVGAVQDGTPFQGVHWVHPSRFVVPGSAIDEPSFLMYSPDHRGNLQLVGVAYSRRLKSGETPPADLAGVPARWHEHQACYRIPGIGLALADGTADCEALGGIPTPRLTSMVHVWTVENPDGALSAENPWLPFMAVGLEAPRHSSPEARALALALAESYGFRPPFARRIDALVEGTPVADSLWTQRVEIGSLVKTLSLARERGDSVAGRRSEERILSAASRLRQWYAGLSPTPEFRERLERQFTQALEPGHHH